jgi:hypothetical protein
LEQQLQSLRALDLAPQNWPSALLDTLESSAREESLVATADTLTSEVITNPAIAGQLDTIPPLVALVMVQRISVKNLIAPIKHFISVSLPRMFDGDASLLVGAQSSITTTASLARMIQLSLLVLSHTEPASADVYTAAILEEFTYQRQRPVKRKTSAPQGKKRRVDEIGENAKAALEVIVQALGRDDELKSRWERFGDLAAETAQ